MGSDMTNEAKTNPRVVFLFVGRVGQQLVVGGNSVSGNVAMFS